MSPSSSHPVSKCAPGGDQLLRRLYEAHYLVVHHRCRRILQDSVAADDAAQETFLRVQRHLELVTDITDVRPWILRIAVNYCLNQLRDRRAREKVLEATHAELELDVEHRLIVRDEARRLFSSLPRHLSSLAWLRDVEGLDQHGIALALGVSRRTVVSRLAELRRFAAEVLELSA